jgi:hypothetical protein
VMCNKAQGLCVQGNVMYQLRIKAQWHMKVQLLNNCDLLLPKIHNSICITQRLKGV